jgi:hypothetical protein
VLTRVGVSCYGNKGYEILLGVEIEIEQGISEPTPTYRKEVRTQCSSVAYTYL